MPTTPLLSETPEIYLETPLSTLKSKNTCNGKFIHEHEVYSWTSFNRERRLLSLILTRWVIPSVNFTLKISRSSPPLQVYATCNVQTGSYVLICKKRLSALTEQDDSEILVFCFATINLTYYCYFDFLSLIDVVI